MYLEITSYNILMNPITFEDIEYFPIPSYDKIFISRCGKILSCRSPSGRCKEGKEYRKLLKVKKRREGYLHVSISGGYRPHPDIHRLLAMTFFSDFSPELQVDHKDNNKLNNDLSNLHMVTRRGNQRNILKYSGVRLMYDKRNESFHYRTNWCDENGLRYQKSFSCQCYSFGFALMMAHAKRQEMVDLYYNRPIL